MSNPPRYLYRKKDGTHTWLVRFMHDGKQHSRTFAMPTDSQRKANVAALDVEAKLRRQVKRSTSGAAKPGSIAELIDDWLNTRKRTLAPNTLAGYRSHSNLIRARFGSVLVEELEARDVDRWFGELADLGTGSASVERTFVVWKIIMGFATKKRRYVTSIVDQVDRPIHRKGEVRLPTNEALRVALGDMSGDWGRAIALLAETGMRRGEVNGLRWTDVDGDTLLVERSISADGDQLVIGPTKTNRSRLILLSARARAVIAEQHAQETPAWSPWMFPAWRSDTSGGTPHAPSWLTQAWTKHRRTHGLDGMHLHHLRHAYATRLLSDGVPIHVVQEMLGHTNATTTMNAYGHADEAGRDALRRSLDRQIELEQPE